MRTSPLPWAQPCLLPISTTYPGCLTLLWSAGIVNPILAPGLLFFYSTILTCLLEGALVVAGPMV